MIDASRNRKINPQISVSFSNDPFAVDVTMEHAPRYQTRLGELHSSSRKGGIGTDTNDFFDSLRAESFKAYDEKIKENKQKAENEHS